MKKKDANKAQARNTDGKTNAKDITAQNKTKQIKTEDQKDAQREKQKQQLKEPEASDEVSGNDVSHESLGESETNKSGYEITIPLYVTANINCLADMQLYFGKDPDTGKSQHDPNGRCLKDGSTPLHLAIRGKQLNVVKLLLKNGADISLCDSAGDNILMRAIRSRDANMINTVWRYRGAIDINHTNTDGMSALHISAEQKWECCLNFLLQNKADPNIQNTRTGVTPLMIAAANGDTKIVENLIRAGAEILVEDFEGFTCVYKAFENKHKDMMGYLLKHLSEDDKELFVKARLDYLLDPPILDEEKKFVVDMYFPLLAECTNHRELRPSMYNQRAIHRVALKVEEYMQNVDIVISGSHLMFCIMFKFGDPIDFKFLRQYLHCKGPDLTIEVTKYYTEVWKMSERSIIAVFLPMIGLAVIPEGRSWIKKHYLSVSEYINFFKKENLKQYIAPNPEFEWCLNKGQFYKIYKVWNHFYDVVNEIQTEQRVKNMNELLEEEEKEKERQVKKKEKKKQKKQDKLKRNDEEKLYCETGGLNVERNDVSANANHGSCTDSQKDQMTRSDVSIFQNATNNSKLMPSGYSTEPEFSQFSDQWTTVQPKRHTNKDKANVPDRITIDQMPVGLTEKTTGTKGKRGRKPQAKLQRIPIPQAPIPIPNCNIKTRWADIAKAKPKVQDSNSETPVKVVQPELIEKPKPVTFAASDFPSLSGKSPTKKAEKKQDKTGMFTFYFHDECNAIKNDQVQPNQNQVGDGNQVNPTNITFLGEPVDGSNINADGVMDILDQPTSNWTWERVAEIGEYGRRTTGQSTDSQSDRTTSSNECMDHIYTGQTDFQSDEIFVDDIAGTEIGNSTYEPKTPSVGDTNRPNPHVTVLGFPFPENTPPRGADVSGYECDHGMPYQGFQEAVGDEELFYDPADTNDYTMNPIPKWAQEIEGFEDEINMPSDSPEHNVSQIGDHHQGIIPPEHGPGVDVAVQDLAYTDPAIIGCGGLHKPYDYITQVDQQDNNTPVTRQLHCSRFLGNVIKDELPTTGIQEENSSCKGHKGWSNKRRMKTKPCPQLSTKNWTFGDKLLETAHQLDQETPMEGVCYPESLYGNQENEVTHFFPSFHENTKLSSQIDPRNFSFVHRVQMMQLAERQEYIDNSIKSTQDETLFAYYASCAGLNQQQYQQLIEKIRNQSKMKARDPLKELLEKQQSQCQNNHQVIGDTKPTWTYDPFIHQEPLPGIDKVRSETMDVLEKAATNLYNYQSHALGCKPFQNETKTTVIHPESLGIPVPSESHELPTIPPSSANIYAIQTAQSEMQRELTNQIRDMYRGILKDRIRSIRWREHLWNMRNIPVEKQMIISKMVIPADERDRCYISLSSSDSTVLGFLTDGTEVAVKIVDGQSREFTQSDLQYLVDMDVSKYFMMKYRDYCFHDGIYYIATDLYEYSLSDYIVELRRSAIAGSDTSTTHSKLIWQLMRGLESLHQNCLMVHGELRPDNVVIDRDGNVRIAGYGLGRNAGRDGPFLDYSDEEKCWLAPEVLVHKQKVSFKSDIWVAGMLMYYVLSGGKNPFGTDVPNIIWNIGNQGYTMDYINEEAGHLICQMLSINKSERPCISEAMKHPYFWGQEKQLRFIIIAGSDVLRDVKAGVPMSGAVKDSMITIIGTSLCHLKLVNWIPEVEPIVIREMKAFRQYKNNIVELVLFVYNVCTHFDTLSEAVREIIEEPCKYFLTKFPTLFMTVYRAIRKSSRAERTCYKAFF